MEGGYLGPAFCANRQVCVGFRAAKADEHIVQCFFGKMSCRCRRHIFAPSLLRTAFRARWRCVLTVLTAIPSISLISSTDISSENFIRKIVRWLYERPSSTA